MLLRSPATIVSGRRVAAAFRAAALRRFVVAAFLPAARDFRVLAAFVAAALRFFLAMPKRSGMGVDRQLNSSPYQTAGERTDHRD